MSGRRWGRPVGGTNTHANERTVAVEALETHRVGLEESDGFRPGEPGQFPQRDTARLLAATSVAEALRVVPAFPRCPRHFSKERGSPLLRLVQTRGS